MTGLPDRPGPEDLVTLTMRVLSEAAADSLSLSLLLLLLSLRPSSLLVLEADLASASLVLDELLLVDDEVASFALSLLEVVILIASSSSSSSLALVWVCLA